MFALYLAFDWLGRHPVWTALGIFVLAGTFALVWVLDRPR
jgi:hypothetical protein